MWKNILVAIDQSDVNSVVFAEALNLAKLKESSLLLLHVLSRDEEGYPMVEPLFSRTDDPGLEENYYERWKLFEEKGLIHLKKYVALAQVEGVQAEIMQEIGHPGKIICEIAKRKNIDLIVMGSRGRSGIVELLLGSQSNYVLHRAHCSVLIARGSTVEKAL